MTSKIGLSSVGSVDLEVTLVEKPDFLVLISSPFRFDDLSLPYDLSFVGLSSSGLKTYNFRDRLGTFGEYMSRLRFDGSFPLDFLRRYRQDLLVF